LLEKLARVAGRVQDERGHGAAGQRVIQRGTAAT
jgi:hypothetical protein